MGLDLDAPRRLELIRLIIQRLRHVLRDGQVKHRDIVGRRIRRVLDAS